MLSHTLHEFNTKVRCCNGHKQRQHWQLLSALRSCVCKFSWHCADANTNRSTDVNILNQILTNKPIQFHHITDWIWKLECEEICKSVFFFFLSTARIVQMTNPKYEQWPQQTLLIKIQKGVWQRHKQRTRTGSEVGDNAIMHLAVNHFKHIYLMP